MALNVGILLALLYGWCGSSSGLGPLTFLGSTHSTVLRHWAAQVATIVTPDTILRWHRHHQGLRSEAYRRRKVPGGIAGHDANHTPSLMGHLR